MSDKSRISTITVNTVNDFLDLLAKDMSGGEMINQGKIIGFIGGSGSQIICLFSPHP